jgi:hypothetical protein
MSELMRLRTASGRDTPFKAGPSPSGMPQGAPRSDFYHPCRRQQQARTTSRPLARDTEQEHGARRLDVANTCGRKWWWHLSGLKDKGSNRLALAS